MPIPKTVSAALCGLALVAATTACGVAATGGGAAVGVAPVAQSSQVRDAAPATAVAATAATTTTTSAPAGATRLELVAGQSTASYSVTEQLAGRDLPNNAVGTTVGVSGAIVVGADGAVVDGSRITIDLTRLQSDETRRDNFVKNNTLQTGTYPTAEFVPTRVEGLTQPLPTAGDVQFTLVGDLTVHGVTREVAWDVTAQAKSSAVAGTARTTVTFSQFGLTAPKVGPVLSVADELTLQLDFKASRAAAA
jgi:polyisoprenoid-binding protein YceI